MTLAPTLRRLADSDPARELDPLPREELLARLLAEPRPARQAKRASHRRRVVVPAVALGAVAAVGVVTVIVGGSPSRSLDPAARAYAGTSAVPGMIVHTIATTDRTETTAAGETHASGRIEEWHRGGETHRIETFSKGGVQTVVDDVVGPDGVTSETEGGTTRTVSGTDPKDSASMLASGQTGFVEDFRQHYEKGELDAAGDVQFAGRPAVRYIVSPVDAPSGATAQPGPTQVFYVDRETGAPLGYTSTLSLQIRDMQGGVTPTTLRFVEVVRSIEQLEPTQANLHALHGETTP